MWFYVLSKVLIVFVVLDGGNGARIRKYSNQPYNGPYYQEKSKSSHEEGQDLSKIPGEPGKDYPVFHSVPETGFSCASVPYAPGIYANVETGCQAYHVCHDGREGHQGAAFLCSNGTLFNQEKFTCDWWYNVDCQQATSMYRLNADPETNPFEPKHKSEEELDGYKSSTPSKYYQPHAYSLPATQKYQRPRPVFSQTTPTYYQHDEPQYHY